MTLDDVAVYLMGPVLGFMLRLRGRICLHASVVCIDDQAVAFVGPGRSGKSTTAAALLKLGWPILTDDVAAITIEDCSFLVEPAYPHVRLWPNAVNILYGDEEALPRLVPVGDWDKCYLNLANKPESFQTTPVSLRAVYVLENRVHGDVAGSITSLSPAAAMIALVANTYANKLINRSLRSEEFQVLTSLVGSIPIKKIIPNSNPTLLPDLCESIIKDFRQSATDAGRVAAVGS